MIDPITLKAFILGVGATAACGALILILIKSSLLTELSNNKTYILAGFLAGVQGLELFEVITPTTSSKIQNYVLVGLIFTFRSAITKVKNAIEDTPIPVPIKEPVTPKRVEKVEII